MNIKRLIAYKMKEICYMTWKYYRAYILMKKECVMLSFEDE